MILSNVFKNKNLKLNFFKVSIGPKNGSLRAFEAWQKLCIVSFFSPEALAEKFLIATTCLSVHKHKAALLTKFAMANHHGEVENCEQKVYQK